MAQSETKTQEILADFIANVRFEADIVGAVNPTNPLLTDATIDFFFKEFINSKAQTAFSVSALRKHVLLGGVPVNYSPFGPQPRTQDVQKMQVINWALAAWRVPPAKQRILSRRDSLYVGEVTFIEIPALEAFDIDTFEDFLTAQALASLTGRAL